VRRSRLALLAVLVCATPAPGLAQAWPAGAVVSMASVRAPTPAPQARMFQVADATPTAPIAHPEPPQVLKLRPRTILDAEDRPPVEIRPKAEWTDDQGFSATVRRVTYKLRF